MCNTFNKLKTYYPVAMIENLVTIENQVQRLVMNDYN